jgi:predicted DNA-binding transcriptional regulator AlpA
MSEPAVVIDLGAARARRVARAQEPWVSKREIAAHCGVGVRTIERWVAERGFPQHKRWEHGVARYRVSEADEWMEGNE